MKSPRYCPTPEDIRGAMQMINMLAEGGTLTFPNSILIYSVSHKTHTLKLMNPEATLLSFEAFVKHIQTIWVWEEIGYTVWPDERIELLTPADDGGLPPERKP